MRAALLMHSPKSIAATGGILVIVVLFVVLALLAGIAKLIQAGQSLAVASSRTSSRVR
jgi:type IV secretory pathway TrbD component